MIQPGHVPADAFQLSIFDETYLDADCTGEFKLAAVTDGGETVVTVSVEDAVNLKALYCRLDYDPLLYNPQTVESTGNLDPAGGEIISLPELLQTDPGQVAHGQVLPWPDDRQGFSGDADLVVVRFTNQPDDQPRATSATVLNRLSQSELTWDGDQEQLSWFYYNSGDYNTSGMVEIGDMTVLGQHWKATSGVEGPFDETDPNSVVDYDFNGEINIVEMLPIRRFYGNQISQYRVYTSLDAADYPAAPEDPNGPGAVLLGTVNMTSSTEHPAVRRYYTFTVDSPEPGAYYWIRPSDGTNEGIASTLAGGPD